MDKEFIKKHLELIEDSLIAIYEEVEPNKSIVPKSWEEERASKLEPKKQEKNKVENEVIETPPWEDQHPFGEVIDEAWLAINVCNKTMHKNTAMIWYTFPKLNKAVAYYYDPKKIEVDGGFAWNVEEGKFYIIQNQKWSSTKHWMWNKIWEIPEETYNSISFKVSQNVPPSQDLLNSLDDSMLCKEDHQMSEIQKEMRNRAENRSRIGKIK